MNIPPDKIKHAAVGLAVSLFSLVVWAALAFAGLAPMAGAPAAAALGALVAGIVKEGADWMDNKAAPGMHGVEALDALCTAAPGVAVGVLAALVL